MEKEIKLITYMIKLIIAYQIINYNVGKINSRDELYFDQNGPPYSRPPSPEICQFIFYGVNIDIANHDVSWVFKAESF